MRLSERSLNLARMRVGVGVNWTIGDSRFTVSAAALHK